MTAINSIVTSGVGESGFSSPQNPQQNPQSQAVLTLFPVIDSQRPFLKAGEELWCVTLGGEVLRGPTTRSECEAFAETWNQVAIAPPSEELASADKPRGENQDELRFAVVIAPVRPEIAWIPKGAKSQYPVEHSNLPLLIAEELAEYINRAEQKAGRGCTNHKIAIVTRRVHDSKNRFCVQKVPGGISKETGLPIVHGCKLRGATLQNALEEAHRINSDIVAYSAVPKVWAVVAVEGSWLASRVS